MSGIDFKNFKILFSNDIKVSLKKKLEIRKHVTKKFIHPYYILLFSY